MSQDPTDNLIRELIGSGREASAEEVVRIVERVVTVPFVEETRVKAKFQGLSYGGITLGRTADSLDYHLVQRVLEERWAKGTTREQYLEDLRRSANDPNARVLLYERGARYIGVLGVNRAPEERWGANAQPLIYVVYSADRGRLMSGYMVANKREIDRPEGARWLR